jgi:hypothetical protein
MDASQQLRANSPHLNTVLPSWRSMRWSLVLAVPLIALLTEFSEARCNVPEGRCSGCGCKGGPGYRELSTNRCVGFRDLQRKCGSPTSALLCSFEGAEGYGANRECALAPRKPANAQN